MIKFPIGRGPDNRYLINDPTKVISNNHAIISQYSDGRVTITDISSNGTTLNGHTLPKGKEINIRRGDQVVFADIATLEWSRIPIINFPPGIISTYNIGRSPENNYITKSDDTGRNHACLVVTSDNKYYILDQSKTGTLINGDRLPVYQFVKTKKCDKIKFGDSELLYWNKIAGSGLSCNTLKLIYFGLPLILLLTISGLKYQKHIMEEREKREHIVVPAKDRTSSLVMIYNKFYYTVKDQNSNVLYYYGTDNDHKESDISRLRPEDAYIIIGTGFFISNDGKLISNRHVLEPWSDEDNKKYFIPSGTSWVGFVKGGVSIEIGIIPNGANVNKSNFESSAFRCDLNTLKSHQDVDLALIQIQGKQLPTGSSYIPMNDIASRTDLKSIKESEDIVIIGYPRAFQMYASNNFSLTPIYDNGKLSNLNDIHTITYNANTDKGASGSPVIHIESGKIIAVNTYMLGNNHNFGIQSDYIHQLVN